MKLTKARLKQIIKETIEDIAGDIAVGDISDEDVLGTDRPQHDVGSPEQQLLSLMHASEELVAMKPEERAQFLQQFLDDEQVLALVDALTTRGASLASPW